MSLSYNWEMPPSYEIRVNQIYRLIQTRKSEMSAHFGPCPRCVLEGRQPPGELRCSALAAKDLADRDAIIICECFYQSASPNGDAQTQFEPKCQYPLNEQNVNDFIVPSDSALPEKAPLGTSVSRLFESFQNANATNVFADPLLMDDFGLAAAAYKVDAVRFDGRGSNSSLKLGGDSDGSRLKTPEPGVKRPDVDEEPEKIVRREAVHPASAPNVAPHNTNNSQESLLRASPPTEKRGPAVCAVVQSASTETAVEQVLRQPVEVSTTASPLRTVVVGGECEQSQPAKNDVSVAATATVEPLETSHDKAPEKSVRTARKRVNGNVGPVPKAVKLSPAPKSKAVNPSKQASKDKKASPKKGRQDLVRLSLPQLSDDDSDDEAALQDALSSVNSQEGRKIDQPSSSDNDFPLCQLAKPRATRAAAKQEKKTPAPRATAKRKPVEVKPSTSSEPVADLSSQKVSQRRSKRRTTRNSADAAADAPPPQKATSANEQASTSQAPPTRKSAKTRSPRAAAKQNKSVVAARKSPRTSSKNKEQEGKESDFEDVVDTSQAETSGAGPMKAPGIEPIVEQPSPQKSTPEKPPSPTPIEAPETTPKPDAPTKPPLLDTSGMDDANAPGPCGKVDAASQPKEKDKKKPAPVVATGPKTKNVPYPGRRKSIKRTIESLGPLPLFGTHKAKRGNGSIAALIFQTNMQRKKADDAQTLAPLNINSQPPPTLRAPNPPSLTPSTANRISPRSGVDADSLDDRNLSVGSLNHTTGDNRLDALVSKHVEATKWRRVCADSWKGAEQQQQGLLDFGQTQLSAPLVNADFTYMIPGTQPDPGAVHTPPMQSDMFSQPLFDHGDLLDL